MKWPSVKNEALDELLKQAKEIQDRMTPFERALEAARQKRGYVVSELMWGTDADEAAGRDAMTREQAEKIYDATDEGIALKALELQSKK